MDRDKKLKLWLKAMDIGKITGCHQMSERSFNIKGYQFPVCARCTGVLIGQILGTIAFIKRKGSLALSFILSFIMFFDWELQYKQIKESTNIRRLITGVCGGFGLIYIHLSIIKKIFNLIKEK